MKVLNLKLPLILFTCILLGTTLMCSTGYITPASLTSTAFSTPVETQVPTAFFIRPTETNTPPPSPTATQDPRFASPTPIFDTPTPSPTPEPSLTPIAADNPPMLYYAQSGDTINTLASRFSVNPFEIVSPETIPAEGLIPPGQMLMIPNRLVRTTSNIQILPDSEIVYSPTALDFNSEPWVEAIGGYITEYKEYLSLHGITPGGEIVEIVALNQSINPRLLLAIIQYNGSWVLGDPGSFAEESYPAGYINVDRQGLFSQLNWASTEIMKGYYAWRAGAITDLTLKDGSTIRLAPDLNAGTVGLMYYFAQIYSVNQWNAAINPNTGIQAQYTTMFGDPWARDAQLGSLLPAGLVQPNLILPFYNSEVWAYTGGPHGAWAIESAQAAIDFAPSSVAHGCAASPLWTTAMAPGLIVRLENGVLILDLDGDGNEQTGWVLFYLHLDPKASLKEGNWVEQGALLGHPSCEGGRATGTHIHIGRKFNGEWILADGPIPFEVDGWQVVAGEDPYEGYLVNGTSAIEASSSGSYSTRIRRPSEEE
jgi:murein DD-endopeptidase MepM/ murein hydrolase activator NlpD